MSDIKRLKILKSAKKVEIVPGEMSDMDIDMISLVHKGANKQKIQIYKEDETEEDIEEEEVQGLLGVLKSYFVERIQKAEEAKKIKGQKKTFSNMMAVSDISENMWRANDTLRTVMRDIINNEEVTDKKASLLQAIDEYCMYMKNKVNTATIAKEDSFFDVPETEIEKAGKKVSSKNLEALKAAQRALSEVISEAEFDTKIDKEEQEVEEVKKEELTEIMKQTMEAALKPINDRIDKIEKADGGDEQEEVKEEVEGTENVTEIIKSIITEALYPLEDRLEKVEKSRGIARSLEGEEETGKIKKNNDDDDTFEDYFI